MTPLPQMKHAWREYPLGILMISNPDALMRRPTNNPDFLMPDYPDTLEIRE